MFFMAENENIASLDNNVERRRNFYDYYYEIFVKSYRMSEISLLYSK
jgi:hypothetical protein